MGKCPNCSSVIEDDVIKAQAQAGKFGHQLYAVAYKRGKGSLEFRTPTAIDLAGVERAEEAIKDGWENLIPDAGIPHGQETERLFSIGIDRWEDIGDGWGDLFGCRSVVSSGFDALAFEPTGEL